MRDPLMALDLDMAIAMRARHVRDTGINEIIDAEDGGGFFAAVLALLSE